MATYKYLNAINNSGKRLFTIFDLEQILGIRSQSTLQSIIKRFVKEGIFVSLERGKYILGGSSVSDFEIAQFLYSPSYVSFETALNYHGILSQFPFEITSVTTKSPTRKKIEDKLYTYSRLSTRLYIGYYEEKGFLIANPEKALFDQLYMISRGLKTESCLGDMDFSIVDKAVLKKYTKLLPPRLVNKVNEFILKYI
ncbi:hypothetical protein JW962_00370 [Candidatus Dojkabacteria bacterium]|nr:hypothetical protein [Candidatus Dojkabacteria bacterium]